MFGKRVGKYGFIGSDSSARGFWGVFCRGGFFFIENNISGCYLSFSLGGRGFWMSSKGLNGKRGKKES